MSLSRALTRAIVRPKRYVKDLEQLPVINRVRNFPSLESFPQESLGSLLVCLDCPE